MNNKNLYSKLITQICNEDYSRANSTLESIITKKIQKKIVDVKNNVQKSTK